MNPTLRFLRLSLALALALAGVSGPARAESAAGSVLDRLPAEQRVVLEHALPSRDELASIPEGCFLFSVALVTALQESGRFDEVALTNVRANGGRGQKPDHTGVLFRSGRDWFLYETNFGLQSLGQAATRAKAEAAGQRALDRAIRSRQPSRIPESSRAEATAVSRAQALLDGAVESSRVDTFRGGKVSVLVFRTRSGFLGMYEPRSGTAWGEYRAETMPSPHWVETFLTREAGFAAFSG